jgi:hypothetical protein
MSASLQWSTTPEGFGGVAEEEKNRTSNCSCMEAEQAGRQELEEDHEVRIVTFSKQSAPIERGREWSFMCVCVCVCVRERERERD